MCKYHIVHVQREQSTEECMYVFSAGLGTDCNSQVLISYLTTTHTAVTGLSSRFLLPGVYRFLSINCSRQESETATVPSPEARSTTQNALDNRQACQAVLQHSHARSHTGQQTERADCRADCSLPCPEGCCKYLISTHGGMPQGRWALSDRLPFSYCSYHAAA